MTTGTRHLADIEALFPTNHHYRRGMTRFMTGQTFGIGWNWGALLFYTVWLFWRRMPLLGFLSVALPIGFWVLMDMQAFTIMTCVLWGLLVLFGDNLVLGQAAAVVKKADTNGLTGNNRAETLTRAMRSSGIFGLIGLIVSLPLLIPPGTIIKTDFDELMAGLEEQRDLEDQLLYLQGVLRDMKRQENNR